ncbi:putative membrane protein [Wolbachia endosymbiont of Trichogramma pretiosum]|nr:putative membrane protein [Wolbachia endosymbiont of Trichogramma pretiosum]
MVGVGTIAISCSYSFFYLYSILRVAFLPVYNCDTSLFSLL